MSNEDKTAFRRAASAVIAGPLVAVAQPWSRWRMLIPQEDQIFIDYLSKEGVPFTSRTEIIRLARSTASTRPGLDADRDDRFANGAVPCTAPSCGACSPHFR